MEKIIKNRISIFVIMGIFLLFSTGCNKKDDNTAANSQVPVVTTSLVSNIGQTTATCGGNVTSQGSSTVIARGVCWSTSANPVISDPHTTDGNGTGTFTSSIAGLSSNTPYYVRAYATNSAGTGYGDQVNFSTQQGTGGTVTDIDGNEYHTLTIGTQVWMVENLKTTKYNDGTLIPLVTDGTAWSSLTTPGYCWYNNDAATYKNTYGAMYNWFAVNTGKLAPTGWHIPTDAEWTTLITFLGGDSLAGGKMKEIGTIHWATPNTGATNTSGFTALPGGTRGNSGAFGGLANNARFWSATESTSTYAFYEYLSYSSGSAYRNSGSKIGGFSVRCLQN